MLLLTLRNLRANRIRLALTTFAVVLGVSFVVSSFVLTDGLRQSFSSLSEEIVGATDLEVRPSSEFGDPKPFAAELVAVVAATDGVDRALGQVVGDFAQPIRTDGTPLSSSGPPLLGFSWVDDPGLSTFTIAEGRAPLQGLEFSIDETTAAEEGFVIGETYGVITSVGRTDLTLVGITRFGVDNQTLGAVLTQFPLETAQTLFDRPAQFDTVLVALDDGADEASVVAELTSILPDTVTVLDKQALIDDTQADFDQGVSILNSILLGFALVSLFVSIFIIANTFAIVFGQRTRDLAMLRAIGASEAQVRRSTMGEALVLGIVASIVGLGGGVLLALGLEGLFNLLGAGLPDAPLILAGRTVLIALVVGVGVTVLSALGPARRASRVAPMAAINASQDRPVGLNVRRTVIGVILAGLGGALAAFGLFGDPGSTAALLAALGVGAASVFIGVMLAGSAIADPILTVVGRPLYLLGTAGQLANQNATRNPARTTSTAASLMVGLTLVTMALVVGESFKQGIGDTLASSVNADYISDSSGPIASSLVAEVGALDEIGTVAGYRYDQIQVNGVTRDVMGTDIEATNELFNIDVQKGTPTNDPGTVMMHDGEAKARGLTAGDPVEVSFPSGAVEVLTVSATFADNTIVDVPYVMSTDGWDGRFGSTYEVWAAAAIADGVSDDVAQQAIAEVLVQYPNVSFDTQDDLQASLEGQIDQMLVVINAMLVLAVLIALIGIANTLALSVFERTREIGLLRAVGMSRRQSRRMIRWEAVQIALFGALLGVSLGIGFGWAATAALPDTFISSMSIPVGRIGILVAVCAVAGLIAAAFPARRASRLDVLEAIAM